MDRRFIAVLAVILGIFVAYVYVVKNKDDSSKNGTVTASVSNHSRGAGNKKVTLTEYGDFQCPVCGQYYPIIKQIEEKYGDDITFTFRHFPLDSVHPNARAASRAAEAAGKQGKFFEMYDLIYTNQTSWSNASNSALIFEGYATQLGLNTDTFKSDYASEEVNAVINADLNEGKGLNISGTPTFYLNGRLMQDSERRSYDEMVKAIDAEIAKVAPAPTNP
jgi:protein-disulfide isomerase